MISKERIAVVGNDVWERNKNPLFKGDIAQKIKLWRSLSYHVIELSKNNRFCGDEIHMAFAFESPMHAQAPRLVDAIFEGYGCSLCIASADVVIEFLLRGTMIVDMETPVDYLLSHFGDISISKSRRRCVELPISIAAQALEEIRVTD